MDMALDYVFMGHGIFRYFGVNAESCKYLV